MYSELIESANDLLLFRKFDECIIFCEQTLKDLKTVPENSNALLAKEGLCVVCCQAYAELNRWQEVLPFITQLYDGIEDCPSQIVKLCILLHSRMKDIATCTAVANIWLRNPKNFAVEDYNQIVEVYLSHVLLANEKWADISQFLQSCGGINEKLRDEYTKQIRQIQQRKEQDNLEKIEVVKGYESSNNNRNKHGDNKELEKIWTELSDGPFYGFVNKVCQLVKKYIPLSALYSARNIALFAIIFYYVFVKLNFDMLSWPKLATLWSAAVKLWRSMFAPYHLST